MRHAFQDAGQRGTGGRLRRLVQAAVLALSAAICSAGTTASAPGGLSLTTADRMEDAGWWPTRGDVPRGEYAGTAACRQCHGDIAAAQETTSMAHAATPGAQATPLGQRTPLAFHEGDLTYSLSRSGTDATFAVSHAGGDSLSATIAWAFGVGRIGQTYVLKQDDRYLEGRLSYYTSLSALDITTGHSSGVPADLAHALGNRLAPESARQCFSCHMTAAVTSGGFDPAAASPGVGCEACHGPGAKHVAAMDAAHYEQASATILNPASMSPSDSVDFCGSCHRTWADVALGMPANLGHTSLRFQPYRLEKSRCWGRAGDARITCIACHDPHQPLVRDTAAYDPRCLSCHLGAKQQPHGNVTAPACKVAARDCASCHMPKLEVPGTHANFTDHDIRVVRAGEQFPL